MHARPLPGPFTILASLVPLIFCAGIIDVLATPPSLGAWAGAMTLYYALLPAAGGCLLFGFIAVRRREPRAARIVALSIAGCVLGIAAYLPFRPNYFAEMENKERARTWGATGSIRGFVPQPDGRIVIAGAGLARLLPDGALDPSFRPDTDRGVYRRLGVCGEFEPVQLAVQPDGKILVVGDQQLSRLNPDASIDDSFQAPVPDGSVYAVKIQPDGRILVGGSFWRLGEKLRWGIGRLAPNGALDAAFQPPVEGVADGDPNLSLVRIGSLVSDATGGVVIAGLFKVAGESGLVDLARLNPNGALDRAFALGHPSPPDSPAAMPGIRFVDPFGDGFLTANGTRAFLNFDSAGHFVSHDFKAETGGGLTRFLADRDGTLLATAGILWRIRPDGTPVSRFSAETANIESLAFQGNRILGLADGRLHRFLPNGDPDPSFAVAELKVHR